MLSMSQFVGDKDELGSGVRKSMQSAFEGGQVSSTSGGHYYLQLHF